MSTAARAAQTSLVLRPAAPADTTSILELVKVSLGEGKIPRHADYWVWKHHRNPFGTSPCLLAEAEGRLVGLRVFMRWDWLAQGTAWPAIRAVDTATHPEWRGKGIFNRLTLALVERMTAEGMAFVFNTPNDQSRPGYLKMGWVDVGRVTVHVRISRPLRIAGALARSRLSADPTVTTAPPGNIGLPVSALIEDPALEHFLQGRATPSQRFSTPRTREYLRWRYADIPGVGYRALWNIDGVDGAVVLARQKNTGGLRELRLCEVLLGGGRKSQRMSRDLLHEMSKQGEADYVTAMAPFGSSVQRTLFRSGFMPAPRVGPRMTVRPLNTANGLDPLQLSNWELAIGDLELF